MKRKIRPLAILAGVVLIILFQFFRRGGHEVFTFDSLPPYTDDGKYVKKPVPPQVPGPIPPPPPDDWPLQYSNPAGGRLAQDDPSRNRHSQLDPPGVSDSQTGPPQNVPPGIHHEDAVSNSPPGGMSPHDAQHVIHDQPPAPGDVHGAAGHPQNRLYTAEELAPRIEKYPIPPKEIIKLPKMRPITLPEVQAKFPTESAQHKRIRSQRQAAIKRAMTRSWETYRTYAMGHDEVRPVSGRFHDPFCGWGATLVDSLDTLKIMGMDDEYREALQYLADVDFKHTRSYNIPIFETVIRYLGGLVGAYDVSDGKDEILIEKAKDLADMLMGAFDTVNRMPLLRYDWRPQASRMNLRASDDSCLAELGTLSLEFTRLAQITNNHSYYDAVQRIADGFEDFRNSHVPGLFPLRVDVSGCRFEQAPMQETQDGQVLEAPESSQRRDTTTSRHQKRADLEPRQERSPSRAEMANAMRENLDKNTNVVQSTVADTQHVQAQPKCDAQGFIPSLWRSQQEFSFGGEADSTYEYFIKEYVLLGGSKDQYKNLYVKSIEAAEKYLFFRPLVEGDPEIMFSGKYISRSEDDGTSSKGDLLGEMQHLTCFVGGMLALGSKILNRPHDLRLAERITDGCVWAYNATASGVMPETFVVDVCYESPCHWAPPPTLTAGIDTALNTRDHIVPDDLPSLEAGLHTQADELNRLDPGNYGNHARNRIKRAPEPQGQQLAGDQSRKGPPLPEAPDADAQIIEVTPPNPKLDIDPDVQKLAIERQQQTQAIMQISRPASFQFNMDTRYILRPEAIESVFYMWRITGDPIWQEKGWQMWESIERVTWTELAYSAIYDVNDANSSKADSMESFWLAETLKYFYLLYSEPSQISLDEWVFNTEAHPFRRPKVPVR